MSLKVVYIFIALTIPFFLVTVWALVDISVKQFRTFEEKAVWWLVAIIPFFGWLVYFIFGFRRGVKTPIDEKYN